ncbi:PE family protein PE32 [Mycobacterium kubicae]|uniref:PE family protein n=1 Tax=Mycobacterium kubicae TaxID=120959 RepID=A0AAX1J848_9MYCO|nr:PE family protein [Mycobacterium kubicae]MCV7098216.1 PE family protein [Mycobacterium kubicae]OBF23981.1 PE family protein [Mycobacterium kubicae]OBK54711.1 PE family protein [Mycobacterium kubicae]ORV98159.1 PE family protein [Mycobacterium kubicae]QNI08854.1 PE family protein [Mycobacterium kubicae]
MSLVFAEPDALLGASAELQSINAAMHGGNAAAAGPTTSVVPAASDFVSFLTAAQFAAHAKLYQEISAKAAAARERMATTLGLNASWYAASEAVNNSALA